MPNRMNAHVSWKQQKSIFQSPWNSRLWYNYYLLDVLTSNTTKMQKFINTKLSTFYKHFHLRVELMLNVFLSIIHCLPLVKSIQLKSELNALIYIELNGLISKQFLRKIKWNIIHWVFDYKFTSVSVMSATTTSLHFMYSISQEICTRSLLCCALLWLYIDWFTHIHQAYFTGTVAI